MDESRPYVICHMLQSRDGRCTGDFLASDACAYASDMYYRIHRAYEADAFACGRITMESSFTHGASPVLEENAPGIAREDCIFHAAHARYALAFDRKGKLGWQDALIHDADPGYDQSAVVEILCSDLVSDAYLHLLQKRHISYIFGGETELDLKRVLQKLKHEFGIETILLEGGPMINEAFERAGLIDELSLVIAPVNAKTEGNGVLGKSSARAYQFSDLIPLGEDTYFLRAQRKRNA